MIDTDVEVEWEGTHGSVTGTIKLIDDYSDVYGDAEKSGHFFPVEFEEKYYDQPITISGRTAGDKEITPSADDPYLIIRLENFNENPKATVRDTEETVFELDFSEATLPAVKVMEQTDTVSYGQKPVSELMDKDVSIKWSGTNGYVTGSFNHITDWSELPGEPHEGYFFAMNIDPVYKGKSFDFLKGDQQSGHSDTAGDDEMFWILNIEHNKEFTFKSNGEVIAKLDFTSATLNP